MLDFFFYLCPSVKCRVYCNDFYEILSCVMAIRGEFYVGFHPHRSRYKKRRSRNLFTPFLKYDVPEPVSTTLKLA